MRGAAKGNAAHLNAFLRRTIRPSGAKRLLIYPTLRLSPNGLKTPKNQRLKQKSGLILRPDIREKLVERAAAGAGAGCIWIVDC